MLVNGLRYGVFLADYFNLPKKSLGQCLHLKLGSRYLVFACQLSENVSIHPEISPSILTALQWTTAQRVIRMLAPFLIAMKVIQSTANSDISSPACSLKSKTSCGCLKRS